METIKDTAFITALLPLVIIIFVIGLGVVFLYQHFQKNLFIQKLKHQTLKNIHQNDLLRSNIQAQEEERKRIAQDLHDELGAVLSIMRMNIVLLEEQHDDAGGHLYGKLQNIRCLSESALMSMRNISHRLMPPQLETFGLVKTLESVTNQINSTGNIKVRLHAPSLPDDLSWNISLALYRIVMELINNTIRHSGASMVKIDLHVSDDHIVCRYVDNGRGLNNQDSNKGLGRKSIEGRINALNGTSDISTGAAGGFHTTIRLPLYPVLQRV